MGVAVAAAVLNALTPAVLYSGPPAKQASRSAAPQAGAIEEARFCEGLGDRFQIRRTDHFQVCSDAKPAAVERLSQAAEQTYDAVQDFAQKLRIATRPMGERLQVVLFASWADYEDRARQSGFLADAATPGFFDERASRSYIFDSSSSPLLQRQHREPSGRIASSRPSQVDSAALARQAFDLVVRHEIAHQSLHALGLESEADDRVWLKEGLALQFEAGPSFAANWHRMADLKTIDWEREPVELRALISEPACFDTGARRLTAAYAVAGSVVHYLVESRPDAFAKFLLPDGATTSAVDLAPRARIEQFEAAFGPLDKNFELAFRSHLGRLKPPRVMLGGTAQVEPAASQRAENVVGESD